MSKEKKKVITIHEFLEIANEEPNKKIIKTYEGKDNAKYIPIGILQTMLDEIFLGMWDWRSTVSVSDGVITVSGDITIKVIGEDGHGARINRSGVGAVSLKGDPNMLVPIAEAFAFKNACKKIGKRFGADLNREETLEYKGLPILGKK